MSNPISLRLFPKTTPKKRTKLKIIQSKKNRFPELQIMILKYKENSLFNMINTKNENLTNKTMKNKKFIKEGIKTENSDFIEKKKNLLQLTNSLNKTNTEFLNNSQTKTLFKRFKQINTRNPLKFNNNQNFTTSKKFLFQLTSDERKEKSNKKNNLEKYFSKYSHSNSIYSVFQRNLKEENNISSYIQSNINKNQKKIPLSLRPFTNFRVNKDFGISVPINKSITLFNKNFKSKAIGERYEKHMNDLLKLKQFMNEIKEIDKNKRGDYGFKVLSNYLSKNGIFEKKYHTKQYLKNFKEFLKINFDIDPKVSFKNCLFDILNGEYDKYIENPMDSNNQSFIYKSKNRKRNQIKIFKNLPVENTLKLQKNYFSQPSINEIKKFDSKSYMNSLQSSINLSFDKLENFEEIKKRGKLLEFICYNKEKRRNMLNNCIKRIENINPNI